MVGQTLTNPCTDPPHTNHHTIDSSLAPQCPHPQSFLAKTIDTLSFLQLNCHLSKQVTHTVLNHAQLADILLLQEPWINPFTLHPPLHPSWHMFAGFEHQPTNWRDRHKCYIYINCSIPLDSLTQIPNNSKHLLGLCVQDANMGSLTLVNVYNPPKANKGLKDLSCWLHAHNDGQLPLFIFMDSNLHHQIWNPIGYNSTHQEATDLVRLCSSFGFCLTSPKHTPTFYSSKGKGTVIDLIWTNLKASKIISDVVCVTDKKLWV